MAGAAEGVGVAFAVCVIATTSGAATATTSTNRTMGMSSFIGVSLRRVVPSVT
jgi:hypothetical protein